jgi:hypothetical protein
MTRRSSLYKLSENQKRQEKGCWCKIKPTRYDNCLLLNSWFDADLRRVAVVVVVIDVAVVAVAVVDVVDGA